MDGMGAGLSRRDFIAAVAMAGLGFRERLDPNVRFVGDSMTRAHRILSGAILGTSFDTSRRCRVLVVGAGPAGLAAAWRLQGAGIDDVLVTELAEEPFGLLGRFRCGEFGLVPFGALSVLPPSSKDRIFTRLLVQAKAITGFDVASRPSFDISRGGMSPDSWLERRGGSCVQRKLSSDLIDLFDRCLKGSVAGEDLRSGFVGANAAPAVLAELEQWCRREFASKAADLSFIGVQDAMWRTVESSGMRLAPAGGPGVWFDPLVAHLGDRVILDAVVGRLGTEDGRCVAFSADARKGTITKIVADAVLLAVPAISALRLSTGTVSSRPSLQAPESVVRLSVGFGFDSYPIKGAALGSRVELNDDAGTSASWFPHPTGSGPGMLLVRRSFPYRASGPARARLAALYYDTARDMAVESLTGLGVDSRAVTRIDVWRVGHAGVRPGRDGGNGWTSIAQLDRNVWNAGADAIGSMGICSALKAGVGAAEKCLGVIARPSESWLR